MRTLELRTGEETVLTKTGRHVPRAALLTRRQTVVYTRSRGAYLLSPWPAGETGVYRVAADGSGEPVRVTRDGGAPQFGASNDRVYVTRQATKDEVDLSATLVSMNLDGNEAREVVKTDVATEFAVSPDGNWIAFVEGYQAFVAPLPRTGKRLDIGPKAESLPLRRLTAHAGEYLHWSGDSRRIHYALGDELFTRGLEDSFGFVDGRARRAAEAAPSTGRRSASAPKRTSRARAVALTGARIVTMRGDEVIEDGVVVVRDNRIVAVGRRGERRGPRRSHDGRRVGQDDHAGAGRRALARRDGRGRDHPAAELDRLRVARLRRHDAARPVERHERDLHPRRAAAGRPAWSRPRIFSTGTILYGAKAPYTAKIDTLDDALSHLTRLKAVGAISVKSYNQPRREQRQQILEAARQTHMMVVPEGGSLFQLNMSMVVDGHTGVEHALPVPNVYDDVKQLWSQTDVGYTPTLGVAYGGLDGEHYFYGDDRRLEAPDPVALRAARRCSRRARSAARRRPTRTATS